MTAQWKDPPKRKGPWIKRLEPVMKKPGKWALVYEAEPQHAYNLRYWLANGKYQIPEGVWEFKASGSNGGEVYARYLGPQDEPAVVAAG